MSRSRYDEIRCRFQATRSDDDWIIPAHLARHPFVTNRATFRSDGVPRQVPIFDRRDDAAVPEADRRWFSIVNATSDGESGQGDDETRVYIYDEIGYWGVTAGAFIDEFNSIKSSRITLHVSSPGGEVYDGVAIYNAIVNHPATVTAVVDSLAASAASFIVQAADRVEMESTAEMMIHDAIGIAWDNAEGMRALADRLDAVSDTIAGIYATRAGGRYDTWRNVMRAEQWYSADEAVAAGLADVVRPKAGKRKGSSGEAYDLVARWDSSTFRHRDRAHAPAPFVSVRHIPEDMATVRAPAVPVDLDVGPSPDVDVAPDVVTEYIEASWSLDFGAVLREAIDDAPTANLPGEVFAAALQAGLDEAPNLDRSSAFGRVVRPAPTIDFGALLREGTAQ